uniref:SUEL-type lectin domain-containing protein n=1 Tax=Daphnia galeata TaxID=27404 RepID=A0A8J2S3H5_9CRUS|nr:unnamed protein product [Daphnia galeata]
MIPTVKASRYFSFMVLFSSLCLLQQQVSSEIAPQSERGIEESFTCEWDSKTLSCPAGQGIIIDFANYGRTTHPVCVQVPERDKPNNCNTPSHTNFIATFCNGQSSCVVPATNSFFGDTCPNVFKYLQIKYHCETLTPSEIVESFTCEWESKMLSCPSGKTINVDYANYGRTTHPVCVQVPERDKPTNCFTASHTSKISQLCNGQSNCEVPATNSFFGDTCPNVFKYLHIKYRCVCP